MPYWTAVKTSAKNPDQTLGSRGSRDCSMAASLHYNNIIVRLKWYFHMTVESTKYTNRKVNMCAKKCEGRIMTDFIN